MRIKLPSVSGALFNLPVLYQLPKSILDWMGRFDSAASLRKLVGENMSAFLDFFPPWVWGVLSILGILLIWWDVRHKGETYTLDVSPLAAAIVGTVIAALLWGWYLYDRSLGPILWTWDERTPVSVSRSGDVYGVWSIQMIGKNRSDHPITGIKTYVTSKMTGNKKPLLFAMTQAMPAEKVTVPPGGPQFVLAAVLPEDGPGISFDQFRQDYGRFSLTFEYEGGKPYVFDFDEKQTNKIIAAAYRKAELEYDAVKEQMGIGKSSIRVKEDGK